MLEYYSFGTNLFAKTKNSGFGHSKMINKSGIFNFIDAYKMETLDFKTNTEKLLNIDPNIMYEYNKAMALPWHYIVKGNNLKTKK